MQEILYQVSSNQVFSPNPKNIGSFIYHMGRHNLRNMFVEHEIQDKLMLFKNSFKRRSAFGLLHGALVLGLEKSLIFFAKQEYGKFIAEGKFDEYMFKEIQMIMEGLIVNRNLEFEEKLSCWNDTLVPILQGK